MNCKGISGLIFGHKYQPRYSKTIPAGANVKHGAFEGPIAAYAAMLDGFKNITYAGDVCERCGHVVNRKEE
jgi:hypothetical protein